MELKTGPNPAAKPRTRAKKMTKGREVPWEEKNPVEKPFEKPPK
jgi:hypothetical protein